MESLDELATQLRRRDEWEDERQVVDAVCAELQAGSPSFLAGVTGEWLDGFLYLDFKHRDGTVLKLTHGDGYTAVVGGELNYHHYLETACLIAVLAGALHGHLIYVEYVRLGRKVGDYFEGVGREGERLGYTRRGLTLMPFLLRAIPFLPESVRRTQVSFDSTPATRPLG